MNTDCDELLDKYSIVKETLPYLDAPVQGHMKNVETGEMFAFRCIEIIRGSLWHWVLVPVESTSDLVPERTPRAAPVWPPDSGARLVARAADHPMTGKTP